MDSRGRSLLELNGAVLLLGLVPLFAKWIDLGATSIVGWRSLIGAVALAGVIALTRGGFALRSRREGWMLLVLGVVMAGHWSAYFHSIQVSTVAVGVVSMFTWPVMAVLIEPFVFGTRHRLRDLGLAACALIGVGLVVPDFSLASTALHGVAWGLFSALLFALRNVFYKRYLSGYPPVRSMAVQLTVVALCLAPFLELPNNGRDWGLLVVLAVVFTALAQTMVLGTMRQLQAKTVGMISCLQPAYGIGAAALLLGEMPNWRAVLGAAIVFGVAIAETLQAPAAEPVAPR